MIAAWLRAFIFTQLIEVPIYVRGLRCGVGVAFGASALTHPVVWFVFFSPRWSAGYGTKVVAAELFAWLAEAAYFRLVWCRSGSLLWPLLWSLLANTASLSLGLASRALFGVP